MRTRLVQITIAFVALFLLLAAQEARVQLVDRANIEGRPGNPRHAATNEHRGTLYDSTGAPLAFSKGGRRIYSAGQALAQVVGYASPLYGESGLEAALDETISPRAPVADAGSRVALVFGVAQPASVAAGDVVLTLRADIAALVDRALPQSVRGAAVVMDPRNGAILAAVNRPTFDPNKLERDWKSLRSRADSPLLNRSFDGLYPPGSTFKIVTAAAALDSGTITLRDTFNDPGYFEISGFKVHNAEHEATGTQALVGAFAFSSNVDFAQIAMRLGTDSFFDYLRRFHVGEDPGLLTPVARDDVPQPNTVSPTELAQMAFGQASLAVTPLRMALIASTIANGGVLVRPRLVKEFRRPGMAPIDVPPVVWDQPVTKETAGQVRDLMEATVRFGTGTAARLRSVVVAGKTGTGTHPGGPPDAWFACFAPADHPRLAVAVVVEDSGYGGAVAAPIARRILSDALRLYPR